MTDTTNKCVKIQALPPIPNESAHAIAFYKLMADVGRELDVAIKLFSVTRKFLLTTSSFGQDKETRK